jgi:hypothetical protein
MTIPTIDPTSRHHDQPAAAKEQWISSLTDIVTVHPWHDPVVEANPLAVPTASEEAMIFRIPSVGCLAMSMAFRFASYAAEAPSTWAVDDIALTFGLRESVARVRHALDRLEGFNIIQREDRTVWVRLWLPPLGYRQQSKLPRYLAQVYPS